MEPPRMNSGFSIQLAWPVVGVTGQSLSCLSFSKLGGHLSDLLDNCYHGCDGIHDLG